MAQFEAANPGISVRGVQYQWLPATFAAKLASGTLPTVFTVPFTDGRSLGDNGQLANLTKYAQAEPYLQGLQPGGHRRGHRLEEAGHRDSRRPPMRRR